MDDQKIANPQSRHRKRHVNFLLARINKRFYRIPITRRVIGGAVLGVLIIGAVAYWLPDMKDRMKFFADSSLSWLILVVVATQAYIYEKQWQVMRQALEISERARLGIHSIKENFETGRVVVRIENTGKAPATDIEIFAEGLAHIPKHCVPDEATKTLPWKRVGDGWRLIWPFNVDYGNTIVLAGNNPLILHFSLNGWLNWHQRKVMQDGDGHLIFRGHISFHDGFRRDQKAEFSFKYSKGEGGWIHHPIDSPEQVWEKLREQSEQHPGGQGPLYSRIDSFEPQSVIGAAQTKPKNQTENQKESERKNPK